MIYELQMCTLWSLRISSLLNKLYFYDERECTRLLFAISLRIPLDLFREDRLFDVITIIIDDEESLSKSD